MESSDEFPFPFNYKGGPPWTEEDLDKEYTYCRVRDFVHGHLPTQGRTWGPSVDKVRGGPLHITLLILSRIALGVAMGQALTNWDATTWKWWLLASLALLFLRPILHCSGWVHNPPWVYKERWNALRQTQLGTYLIELVLAFETIKHPSPAIKEKHHEAAKKLFRLAHIQAGLTKPGRRHFSEEEFKLRLQEANGLLQIFGQEEDELTIKT